MNKECDQLTTEDISKAILQFLFTQPAPRKVADEEVKLVTQELNMKFEIIPEVYVPRYDVKKQIIFTKKDRKEIE